MIASDQQRTVWCSKGHARGQGWALHAVKPVARTRASKPTVCGLKLGDSHELEMAIPTCPDCLRLLAQNAAARLVRGELTAPEFGAALARLSRRSQWLLASLLDEVDHQAQPGNLDDEGGSQWP